MHFTAQTNLIPSWTTLFHAGKATKLTLSLLLICNMQLRAADTTTITLSVQEASLQMVFTEIKRQTGHQFFYCENTLLGARTVTLTVEHVSLDSVLKICLRDQLLEYHIEDGIVFIKPKGHVFRPGMHMVTTDELQRMFHSRDTVFLSILAFMLNHYMTRFGIDCKTKLAHFLAQAACESADFQHKTENLYYTSERQVKKTFRSSFSHLPDSQVTPYLRNPQKLANRVYANRNGNGDESSEDGFRFRGRGIFQLTGRTNYKGFTKFYRENYNCTLDFVSEPDKIANQPEYAIMSALWYFKINKGRAVMNATAASVQDVSEMVNGSRTGIDQRTKMFNRVFGILMESCHTATTW